MKKNNEKLVYVLKVGINSKGEGIYEFIFSDNIDGIVEMSEEWLWDQMPANANDNAEPPTGEYVSNTLELRTDKFDLFCLHEAGDRSYMDGVHTIHCLAYEVEKEESYGSYEDIFNEYNEDEPLLVFHFGMSKSQVEEMLYSRDLKLQTNNKQKV